MLASQQIAEGMVVLNTTQSEENVMARDMLALSMEMQTAGNESSCTFFQQ